MNTIKLLDLRNEKGKSQEDIAQILGVTRQAYSRYERGERELNYNLLAILSHYFDVSIDYLLGYSDLYYPNKDGKNFSDKERALLAAFRRMLPETQDFLLRTAQSLQEPAENPAPKGTVKR